MEAKDAVGGVPEGADAPGRTADALSGECARLRKQVDAFRIVAEISSGFIDIPLQHLDQGIVHTLAKLRDYAEADRAYFLLFSEKGLVLSAFHEHTAPGVEGRADQINDIEISALLPRLGQIIQDEQVLRIEDSSHPPPRLESVLGFFSRTPLKSSILVAIESAGTSAGFLGLDDARRARAWAEDVETLLHGVGRIFLNAFSRKQHAEALAFERSLMAALMENIPDAIYFKDRQSRFTRISRAQAGLFGLSRPEHALGKTDADFFTEEHAQQALDDEREIVRTGVPVVGKVEKETWPDREETWVSTTKMPLRNATGEIVGTFGISRNITESKKLSQALERHAELLSEANEALRLRNQELDEFTYIASHDLQEPLRKLSAFSDLLKEDLSAGNDDDIQHDIEVLAAAAQRMQRLVQDLLALSRSGRQTASFEPLELDAVAGEAIDALELRVAETGAVIERARLPRVVGDRTLLVQLYQNLVGNALKFTGSAQPHIGLTAARDADGTWLLGVKDGGIGLKPEYADQIFAPFKRLHGRDEYEGTGIGLAICRKIVERHGGRIWVESELGHGAHFQFTLGQIEPGESQ